MPIMFGCLHKFLAICIGSGAPAEKKYSYKCGENEGFSSSGVGFIRTVISLLRKKLIRNSLGLSKALHIFNHCLPFDSSMGFLTPPEHWIY